MGIIITSAAGLYLLGVVVCGLLANELRHPAPKHKRVES